jgi:hypothetical protein
MEQAELSRYMPSCEYGSVLVTSTRYRACNGFKPGKALEIGGLNLQSSLTLLLARAGRAEVGEDGK